MHDQAREVQEAGLRNCGSMMAVVSVQRTVAAVVPAPFAAPAAGTITCCPSLTFAARFTPARSAFAVGPPGLADRVIDPPIGAQPIHARPPHPPADLAPRRSRSRLASTRTDVVFGAAGCGRVPPRPRRRCSRATRGTAPRAAGSRRRGGVDGELRRVDRGHAPRLGRRRARARRASRISAGPAPALARPRRSGVGATSIASTGSPPRASSHVPSPTTGLPILSANPISDSVPNSPPIAITASPARPRARCAARPSRSGWRR